MEPLPLAGLVVSIAGIIAGFIYFRLQRTRKKLIYEVVSNSPLVTSPDALTEQLHVVFDGRRVEEPHLTVVRMANAGNTPIQPTDFFGGVRVDLDDSVDVLAVNVVEASPTSLIDSVSATIEGHAVYLEPLLLNSKDSFSLSVVLDGPASEVRVHGRIAGVADIERKEAVPPEQAINQVSRWIQAVALTVVLGGLVPLFIDWLQSLFRP